MLSNVNPDYQHLVSVLQEIDTNPDKMLFLYDEAEPGSPFVKIPLGEGGGVDGYLIVHPEGWFIDRGE